MDMTSNRLKLATALGVAGAIALSVPSAEARGGRNAALGFGIAAGVLALGATAAAASQPHYYHGGYYGGGPYAYGAPDVYAPSYGTGYYDTYNAYPAPSYYAPAPVYYGRRSRAPAGDF
jgi:hypothetical protein